MFVGMCMVGTGEGFFFSVGTCDSAPDGDARRALGGGDSARGVDWRLADMSAACLAAEGERPGEHRGVKLPPLGVVASRTAVGVNPPPAGSVATGLAGIGGPKKRGHLYLRGEPQSPANET